MLNLHMSGLVALSLYTVEDDGTLLPLKGDTLQILRDHTEEEDFLDDNEVTRDDWENVHAIFDIKPT